MPHSQVRAQIAESRPSLERQFDPTFATQLALREKQIQQNYRPVIGIHKWFARRPGTVFRSLLLAEYNGAEPLEKSYWRDHDLSGLIADPFMGDGTPTYEANRLGFSVLGADTNPMAFWIVRQALGHLDTQEFAAAADEVAAAVEDIVGELYRTTCLKCGASAQVKYFIWVKTERCPTCQTVNDLFPGYLLAGNSRHPSHVVACNECGCLNECDEQPSKNTPIPCAECGSAVYTEGPARRPAVGNGRAWDTTIITVVAVIVLVIGGLAGLLWAPEDAIQKAPQRIFYIHVPTVWVGFLAFFVVFVASIGYLARGSARLDTIARSSAEIGLLFTTLALISGSIWGKAVWGVWWQWDPKQTTTLVLWMIYAAYVMLRSFARIALE